MRPTFASVIASSAVAASAACGPRASTPAASGAPMAERATVVAKNIRELRIVPKKPTACPGDVIAASYVARLADGSSVTLDGSNLSLLSLSAVAAEPRRDGAWQTDANPLVSVVRGFHLTASLRDDSAIHGDTVVVPTYECARNEISLRTSDRYTTRHEYVRMGTFASPFHDSIVVAVFEGEQGVSGVMILGPKQMESAAIKVNAAGLAGGAGRNGRAGLDGQRCTDGGVGEDGDPGEPGEPGGQVDLIVEAESPWVANLVSVFNPGGRGGPGGSGGRGGRAGEMATDARGTQCRTKPGQWGRQGRAGENGAPGPRPRTTSVPFVLLWSGSPIWSNPVANRALEELIAYDQTKRR